MNLRELRNREHLPIALVLLSSLVLNLVGVTWGLPNTIDWSIDTVAPYRVLYAAYSRFSNGWYDRYPPFHLGLLALLYAPYMGYLKLTGGLGKPSNVFPFGLTDPAHSLGTLIFIARLVSVGMGVGIVLLVYLTVRELFDRRAALFSSLIVALAYPMVYYAHTANLDVPYLFWALLGVYWFVRILKRGALKDYLLFALFATLAVVTKDQAYGLFLLALIPILWVRFAERARAGFQRPNLSSVLLDRRNVLAATLAAVVFVLVHNLPFNFPGFVKHVEFLAGPGSGVVGQMQTVTGDGSGNPRELLSALAKRLEIPVLTVAYLAASFTVPLFAACLVGSLYCVRRWPRPTLSLLFLAASYYLTFINLLGVVVPRYVLPIGVLLAFFGGKLLADLWSAGPWRRVTRSVIVAAFGYATVFPLQVDFLFLNDSRYAAEQWLAEHARKGAVVETFCRHSLHNYYPRFPSHVKVRTSRLDAGARWEPQIPRRERVQLPNLDFGRTAPDYIVLSELCYARFLEEDRANSAEAKVLENLFRGRMGYTLVADFKAPSLLALLEIPLNPRILIFQKTERT